MNTRYWLYKCNRAGGPAGYSGDWREDVFSKPKVSQWGGSYSTTSPEVRKRLDEDVKAGDVVVAYQTDDMAVVGFLVVEEIKGDPGFRKLYLRPIEQLPTDLLVHQEKHGTVLAQSTAVNGPVMMRELSTEEMYALLRLAGAPKRVMQGKPKAGGYQPPGR